MLFIKFYARIRYESSLGENVYFSREKNVFIPKVGHLIFGKQKITHQKGCLSSCAHGDMRNLPEKFKLEKPVTTIGHSQSNTKNTTNKNRFFLFETHFKGETFLDQKKTTTAIFFTNKALGTAARKRSANNIQSVSQPSSRLGSRSASSIRDNLTW